MDKRSMLMLLMLLVAVNSAWCRFLLAPAPVADGRLHHLYVGVCKSSDRLLHSEVIVVNNDGKSRLMGDIQVTVEGPVNITCAKLIDLNGNSSGAYSRFVEGGVGHNYVIFEFNVVYGFGFSFRVELYGVSF